MLNSPFVWNHRDGSSPCMPLIRSPSRTAPKLPKIHQSSIEALRASGLVTLSSLKPPPQQSFVQPHPGTRVLAAETSAHSDVLDMLIGVLH